MQRDSDPLPATKILAIVADFTGIEIIAIFYHIVTISPFLQDQTASFLFSAYFLSQTQHLNCKDLFLGMYCKLWDHRIILD